MDKQALAAFTQAQQNAKQIEDLSTKKTDKTYVDTELAKKADQSNLASKADKTYVDTQIGNIGNASPKGVYATLAALQTAFPTGTTGVYLVTGNIKEVDTLTVAAIPTTAGNVTVTLNGVAVNIAVDPATDTTTSAVATKIRNTVFSGWSTGGTGATITFTATAAGTKNAPSYNAGTTGATGTMTVTTTGVNADGNWYYWNGTAWTAGGQYQSSGISDGSITAKKVDFIKYIDKSLFDGTFINGKYLQGVTGGGLRLDTNANYKLIALPVKTNTKYTILKADSVAEDSNFWFKVGTSTQDVNTVLGTSGTVLDGAIKYTNTTLNTTSYSFTTGPSDKSVFINVAKYAEPYTEVLEGDYSVFQNSGYGKGKYIPNNVDIYSKDEVNTLTESVSKNPKAKKIRVVSSAGDFLILYASPSGNYLGYRYGLYQVPDINVKVWKLKDVKIYDSKLVALYTLTNTGYDIEGVLKIDGEADYVGSVHGDEQFTSVYMYIDGFQKNTTDVIDGYYDTIEFVVASDIYHADTTNLAFKKVKSALFDINGGHIKNKWLPTAQTKIYHVRGCLLSINKMSSTTKLINTYRDSVVNMLPKDVPAVTGTTSVIVEDANMVDCTISGDFINAKLWTGKRGGSNYTASIVDFGDRIKPYIDCYAGETVQANAPIYNETNFFITTI